MQQIGLVGCILRCNWKKECWTIYDCLAKKFASPSFLFVVALVYSTQKVAINKQLWSTLCDTVSHANTHTPILRFPLFHSSFIGFLFTFLLLIVVVFVKILVSNNATNNCLKNGKWKRWSRRRRKIIKIVHLFEHEILLLVCVWVEYAHCLHFGKHYMSLWGKKDNNQCQLMLETKHLLYEIHKKWACKMML